MWKLRGFLFVLLVLSTIFLFGCTMHFKGTDVELDTEVVRIYELKKLDLLKRQPKLNPAPKGTTLRSDRTYAG